MKIVRTDNYARETVDEYFVCENVNRGYGELIVTLLKEDPNRNPESWFKLVEDDYELYKWEY